MKNAIVSVVAAGFLIAGCSSHAAAPGPAVGGPIGPSGLTNSVTTVPVSDVVPDTFTGAKVGARLSGETGITDSRYGFVIGYFKGKTSTTSQIVSVSAGQQIKFFNVDTFSTHTVSFLGKATSTSAPWPASFNGSITRSPAGKAIGTKNWTTGPLSPGQVSRIYSTGLPGFYMVGCGFHYNSSMMRTVIIVN